MIFCNLNKFGTEFTFLVLRCPIFLLFFPRSFFRRTRQIHNIKEFILSYEFIQVVYLVGTHALNLAKHRTSSMSLPIQTIFMNIYMGIFINVETSNLITYLYWDLLITHCSNFNVCFR
uniref:Uncharacterized protein n=1 Tax=Cacopsylla melanoneura TaxID=428564 RepID=A0A8D8RM54_9HEMI